MLGSWKVPSRRRPPSRSGTYPSLSLSSVFPSSPSLTKPPAAAPNKSGLPRLRDLAKRKEGDDRMEAPVMPRGNGGRICFPDHGGGDGLPGGWEWSSGGPGWVPSQRPPPSRTCSFTKNGFRFNSKSISVEFSTCGVQVDGKVIKAHIWDTASQERNLPLTNGF